MAPNDNRTDHRRNGEAAGTPLRRAVAERRAMCVPVAVAGVAAATIGLVPALAGCRRPGPAGDHRPGTDREDRHVRHPAAVRHGQGQHGPRPPVPALRRCRRRSARRQDGAEGGTASAAEPQARLMELASGEHTLRVAADGPDKQRVSILDSAAEYSLIHNGDEVWALRQRCNEAYHARRPTARGTASGRASSTKAPKGVPATPQDARRAGAEGRGRHHLGHRRRHGAGRGPRRVPAADQAQAGRLDGRLRSGSPSTPRPACR